MVRLQDAVAPHRIRLVTDGHENSPNIHGSGDRFVRRVGMPFHLDRTSLVDSVD